MFSLQYVAKELEEKTTELKKKWVKKEGDLGKVLAGKPIESDDPFQQFLRQIQNDRAKRLQEEAEKEH